MSLLSREQIEQGLREAAEHAASILEQGAAYDNSIGLYESDAVQRDAAQRLRAALASIKTDSASADTARLAFIADNCGGCVMVNDRRKARINWYIASPIPLSEQPTMLDQCRAAIDAARGESKEPK